MAKLEPRSRVAVVAPVDPEDAVNLATMEAALAGAGGGAPDPHADTHESGGSDPLTPGGIGAAPAGHSHDYAPTAHAHPDLATDTELASGLAGKADTGHTHSYADASHAHGPRVTSLSNVGGGGTITPNAATTDLARVTTTGSTATLNPPSNPTDTAVMNVEVLANAALALTVSGSIALTAGITSPIAVGAGKRLFLGLRAVGTTWYLLAAAPQS